MVTRIYTPIAPPISKPLSKKGTPDEENTSPSGGFNPEQSSKGLASVQEQGQVQKIQLTTIIKDFKSTMNAIGTTDEIKGEVDTYLQTIAIQSQKPAPSVPYIKQSLKTAADSLDQYIAQSLGKPSRVVRDWVDALLLQDIDYRANKTETAAGPSQSAAAKLQKQQTEESQSHKSVQGQILPREAALAPVSAPVQPTDSQQSPSSASYAASASDLQQAEKQQLMAWIEQGKQATDPAQRHQAYQDALNLLGTERRPDLQGKLHSMMGKSLDQAGQLNEASHHFQQATQAFAAANLPQKQATAHYALGSIMEEQGKWDQAKAHYHQAIGLDSLSENAQGVSQGLIQLGSIALQEGEPQEALRHLKEAYKNSFSLPGEKPWMSDIFEHMGLAYERMNAPQQAENAYKLMVQTALNHQRDVSAVSGLERLANLAKAQGNLALSQRYASQANQLLQ